MNDNRPLLEVQNLKKYFKTKRGMLHAVDDVTFTIGKGKTLGVVGESGCGNADGRRGDSKPRFGRMEVGDRDL